MTPTLDEALLRILELEALVAFHLREKEKTVQLLRAWDRLKGKIAKQRKDIAVLEEIVRTADHSASRIPNSAL